MKNYFQFACELEPIDRFPGCMSKDDLLENLLRQDMQAGFLLPEKRNQIRFRLGAWRARNGYKHSYITTAQNLFRRGNTLFTERAAIIHARSIDNFNRAERQQLHSLFNGICCCALNIAYHGDILPRNGVYEAAFACIAHAEKADMRSFARGSIIQAHNPFPFLQNLE